MHLRVTWLVLGLAVLPASAQPSVPPATPLVDTPGRVGAMGKGVSQRIQETYGIDPAQVPIVVLDNRSFEQLARGIMGGGVRAVSAFHWKGTVFVRRNVFRLSDRILAHELLHALSPAFTRQAAARGYHHLIEGATDYFTHRMYPPVRHVARGRMKSAYGHYERFVALLARQIGEAELERCYFEGGFDALEETVDRKLGRGTLAEAASLLQRNDVFSAEKRLGAAKAAR